MPAEAYTLNGFPEEVIAVIAGYSEELAIWRLMAASRAVRNAAQPALQPHVAKQVLIAPLPCGTEREQSHIAPAKVGGQRSEKG